MSRNKNRKNNETDNLENDSTELENEVLQTEPEISEMGTIPNIDSETEPVSNVKFMETGQGSLENKEVIKVDLEKTEPEKRKVRGVFSNPVPTQKAEIKERTKNIEYCLTPERIYLKGFIGTHAVRVYVEDAKGDVYSKIEQVPQTGRMLIDNSFKGQTAVKVLYVRSQRNNIPVLEAVEMEMTEDLKPLFNPKVTIESARVMCGCNKKK